MRESSKWAWGGRIVFVGAIWGGFSDVSEVKVCTLFIMATVMLATSSLLAVHEGKEA